MRKSNYLWLLLVAVLLLPAQEMAAKKKKEKEVTDRELWYYELLQKSFKKVRCFFGSLK